MYSCCPVEFFPQFILSGDICVTTVNPAIFELKFSFGWFYSIFSGTFMNKSYKGRLT